MFENKKQIIFSIFFSVLVTITFTGISIGSNWSSHNRRFREEVNDLAKQTAKLVKLIGELPDNSSNKDEVANKIERLITICEENILEKNFPHVEIVDSDPLDDVLFDVNLQCGALIDQSFRYYSDEDYSYQDYLTDLRSDSDLNMSFEEISQTVSQELPFEKKLKLAATESVYRIGDIAGLYYGLFSGLLVFAMMFLARHKIQIQRLGKGDKKFQVKLTQYLNKNKIYTSEEALKLDKKLIDEIGLTPTDMMKDNPESIYISTTKDNRVWFNKRRQKITSFVFVSLIIYFILGVFLLSGLYFAL